MDRTEPLEGGDPTARKAWRRRIAAEKSERRDRATQEAAREAAYQNMAAEDGNLGGPFF